MKNIDWKSILLIVFSLIIVALIMSTTCSRQKLDKAETNIKALTDTLHTYELKNGELMYEKQGFIAEKKELEKYIGIKEKEIKEIEKKLKSALATIAKMKADVKIDTIHMVDSVTVLPNNIYRNDFNYADKWVNINGTSTFQLDPFNTHTIINNINMEVPLTVGTSKDDKWFIVSDNPYVNITGIDGANLEKAKPKRWSLSLQFGLGGLFGYGISGCSADGIVRTGWILGGGLYGGIGFSYKLIEF